MNLFTRSMFLFCLIGCLAAIAHAENPVDLKPLDVIVEKALAAYNAQNPTAFFADYAKSMQAIANEQTFNALYKGMFVSTCGKYVSRHVIKAESVLFGDDPLVVYGAEFEKNKMKVSVNFTKEDGAFKVMQIQFAPLP